MADGLDTVQNDKTENKQVQIESKNFRLGWVNMLFGRDRMGVTASKANK